jgi:effector-binding domain-containing protein
MDYEIRDVQEQPMAVVKGAVPIAEMKEFFQRAYGLLFETLARRGVAPVGEPLAYYPSEPSDPVDVEAGVVIASGFEAEGEVVASSLPGGRVVVATHVGPYEQLEHTYRDLLESMQSAGLVMRPVGMWEQYLTDSDAEPDPSRWRTRIFIPVEG